MEQHNLTTTILLWTSEKDQSKRCEGHHGIVTENGSAGVVRHVHAVPRHQQDTKVSFDDLYQILILIIVCDLIMIIVIETFCEDDPF